MIVIVGVFQPNAGVLFRVRRKAVKVRVDGRSVIVVRPGMHMLKRRDKECLCQSQTGLYRNEETHPLLVYLKLGPCSKPNPPRRGSKGGPGYSYRKSEKWPWAERYFFRFRNRKYYVLAGCSML